MDKKDSVDMDEKGQNGQFRNWDTLRQMNNRCILDDGPL